MVSIVLERARTLLEYELDAPRPTAGEVLVRTEHVCLMDRDLDSFYYGRGKLPRVFGVSLIGRVAETESDRQRSDESDAKIIPFFPAGAPAPEPGTRVMVLFSETEDGGLREYAAVPGGRCFVIGESIPGRRLPLLPDAAYACGTLSALNAGAGQVLVVLGARASGTILALTAKQAGLNVVLVDPSRPRLEWAMALGIEHTINPIVASLPEELEWFAGGRLDYVVDTSGDPQYMPATLAAMPEGSVLGLCEPIDFEVNLRSLVDDGIAVQSLGSARPDVAAGTALLEHLELEPMISRSVPLVEIPAVVPTVMRERGAFMRLVGYVP